MNRNVKMEALVISVKETARDNRSVCLLTRGGLEWATLFGGPKSKLRGAVSQWNRGVADIYKNQEKGSAKITDFDAQKCHPTFRENLFKSFAAALAGEIAARSQCAGSPERCYLLLNGFLDGMDLSTESESRAGLLRFLWRYLDLLGTCPAAHACARCGKEFAGNFSAGALEYTAGGKKYSLYSPEEAAFYCADCVSPQEKGRRLSEDAVFYLNISGGHDAASLAAARRAALDERDFLDLKAFLYELTESALGLRLKALEAGKGIL